MQNNVDEPQGSLSAKPTMNGESLTIEQAIANLQGEDLGLRVYAAWWLGRFRVGEPGAVNLLIAALEDNADRTEAGGYPLRRNAARALGKLSDRRAVPALIRCLECSDFYVREAAAQSLEMLGDSTSIPALVDLLQNNIPGTLPAPEPPYLAQPYDAILEALGTLNATAAIALIPPFLNHAIPRIQYAAARALYQLTTDPQEASQYGNRLIDALSVDDLQLRRSALADLGAIGYLPAAEAIAETLAENSLKLIALKGLLEKQLQQTIPPNLSEGACRVIALMDELL
ncbi:MAG: HEAT repeat domain-containing protein [Leptolyngbyaceae cyanobacterium RU_5_1]|nr:HEAT repeat domain-containing protein [Leptolyngbyaceae cyanobacterium RU_5_1]